MKETKKVLSLEVGLPYLCHYMVCSKLPGTSKPKDIIFRLNQITVPVRLIFCTFYDWKQLSIFNYKRFNTYTCANTGNRKNS